MNLFDLLKYLTRKKDITRNIYKNNMLASNPIFQKQDLKKKHIDSELEKSEIASSNAYSEQLNADTLIDSIKKDLKNFGFPSDVKLIFSKKNLEKGE